MFAAIVMYLKIPYERLIYTLQNYYLKYEFDCRLHTWYFCTNLFVYWENDSFRYRKTVVMFIMLKNINQKVHRTYTYVFDVDTLCNIITDFAYEASDIKS